MALGTQRNNICTFPLPVVSHIDIGSYLVLQSAIADVAKCYKKMQHLYCKKLIPLLRKFGDVVALLISGGNYDSHFSSVHDFCFFGYRRFQIRTSQGLNLDPTGTVTRFGNKHGLMGAANVRVMYITSILKLDGLASILFRYILMYTRVTHGHSHV